MILGFLLSFSTGHHNRRALDFFTEAGSATKYPEIESIQLHEVPFSGWRSPAYTVLHLKEEYQDDDSAFGFFQKLFSDPVLIRWVTRYVAFSEVFTAPSNSVSHLGDRIKTHIAVNPEAKYRISLSTKEQKEQMDSFLDLFGDDSKLSPVGFSHHVGCFMLGKLTEKLPAHVPTVPSNSMPYPESTQEDQDGKHKKKVKQLTEAQVLEKYSSVPTTFFFGITESRFFIPADQSRPMPEGFLCKGPGSKAYFKLVEALERLVPAHIFSGEEGEAIEGGAEAPAKRTEGVTVDAVDLGAAPGGWTAYLSSLLTRRALTGTVYAVDPAKLDPKVLALENVVHLQKKSCDAAEELSKASIRLLVSDMNVRPIELYKMVKGTLSDTCPVGTYAVLTLKFVISKKPSKLLKLTNHAQEVLGEAGWGQFRVVHLFANKLYERTLLCVKEK